MSNNIKQPPEIVQEQSERIERFTLYKFDRGLGKGIKARIKSYGCNWNSLYHGWICPLSKQTEIQEILKDSRLDYETKTVPFPKGMISGDSKITGLQARLDILLDQVFNEDQQLLTDVYSYNKAMCPQDFAQAPIEGEKSIFQIQIERDFHERWMALQKKKEEIEQVREHLSNLEKDPGEKILDHDAPLLIADALIQQYFLYQNHRTLQYCSNAFWQWNGVQYIELKDGEIRQSVYNFLRDAKSLSRAGYLENFNPNRYKVDQVIDALRSICYHKHHPASGAIWLDGRKGPDPKYLISFSNGLLSTEEWLNDPMTSLIPHTPLLLHVNSLTFNFDPLAQTPKVWEQFLQQIWPEDIEAQQALQEWIGYLLTQDTRQHKILLMVGPPRSGKGTIGRVLRELLGHFNVAGPTLSSLGGDFGLQPLLNQTLALISDARLNSKGTHSIIIERLLSISGEDPLTINRKFLPPLTVQLPSRIMMMSNELPDMRDSSGALAKRFLVLTLKRTWLGKEDISLSNKLQAELPGILLWALQGLSLLQKRGHFIQPTSSNQTIEELEAMTSPIKAFVSEKCSLYPLARITVPELFDEWREWCATTGYSHAGNVQSFGKNIRAAFPEIEMNRPQEGLTRSRYYKGITITYNPVPSADVHGQAGKIISLKDG